MIIQLPTIVPQERTYQQSSKSCLKHGNMMYSIACHLKAIPVFIPKYSLYFPHSSHGGRPSMILNPFKTWNTPQHNDPHLHNGSLASTSADAVNSSISKSKREGWGALDIGRQCGVCRFFLAAGCLCVVSKESNRDERQVSFFRHTVMDSLLLVFRDYGRIGVAD